MLIGYTTGGQNLVNRFVGEPTGSIVRNKNVDRLGSCLKRVAVQAVFDAIEKKNLNGG